MAAKIQDGRQYEKNLNMLMIPLFFVFFLGKESYQIVNFRDQRPNLPYKVTKGHLKVISSLMPKIFVKKVHFFRCYCDFGHTVLDKNVWIKRLHRKLSYLAPHK